MIADGFHFFRIPRGTRWRHVFSLAKIPYVVPLETIVTAKFHVYNIVIFVIVKFFKKCTKVVGIY